MGMRRTAVVATAALLSAVATGCGSSDDEGLSKAEFVKQGDAICAKGNKEIDAAAKKTFSNGEPDKAAISKFVKGTVVPSTRKQVDGLADLDPPKGDGDKIDAITDAANEGLDKVEANPILGTQEGAKDPLAKATKLAKAYGLKVCGSS